MSKQPIIGGQAVIEGVMFTSGDAVSLAVRKPNKKIHVEGRKRTSLVRKLHLHNIPFVRGAVALVDMMMLGTSMMNKSADIATDEEEDEEKKNSFWTFIIAALVFLLSIGIAIAIFKFLPLFVASLLKDVFAITSPIIFTTVEGIVKLCIFLTYIAIIRLYPDIYRVFQYHAAEHMTIRAFEAKKKLTVGNVAKQSRFHPRCGTSFLIFVIVISIILYTIIPLDLILWQKLLARLALLPVLAGISYEILRFTAWLYTLPGLHWVVWPGYAVQALTTAVPNKEHIEVAIKSFEKCVLVRDSKKKD